MESEWDGFGEEAEAMQMPWDSRGSRSEEHIAVLRRLWTADEPLVSFAGHFYQFPNIDPEPRPVQKPPPILIGGHSDTALDRAGRIGDGWVAASMSLDRFKEHVDKLYQFAANVGRDPTKLILVNGMRLVAGSGPTEPLGEPMNGVIERARQFRELGVDYLSMGIEAPDRETLLSAIHRLGEEIVPEMA